METAANITADNITPPVVLTPQTDVPKKLPSGGGRLAWWKDAVTREKYNAFKLLRAEGFSIAKAAETIGYAPSYGETIDRKIKEFEARKAENGVAVGFVTPQRIKRAGAVVDKFMAGKTFGDIKEIKDSTVLRAAECVLDRSDPKRSESGTGPSLSFVTINLGNMALPAPDPVPILDITPSIQGDTDGAERFISDGI